MAKCLINFFKNTKVLLFVESTQKEKQKLTLIIINPEEIMSEEGAEADDIAGQ